MKDVPALLCAVLARRHVSLLAAVFPRVIDNAKMLRNFVQIVRSGAAGRKSLGTAPKRMVREWLDARDDAGLFAASVGQQPSLADILRMVHPRPRTPEREALFGYLVGREHDARRLPLVVQQFEAFKAGTARSPGVLSRCSGVAAAASDWTAIARRAPCR